VGSSEVEPPLKLGVLVKFWGDAARRGGWKRRDHAEVRWGRQIDRGVGRDLSVVRQHAGVVEQFRAVDVGAGDVLQALEEELQRLPVIGREQLSQRSHPTP
jgi:hypothetical protein